MTGRIRDPAVADLNELGKSVKRQMGAELAVVVIQTTDGKEHRQFATDLFNRWGLGMLSKVVLIAPIVLFVSVGYPRRIR
jgi:uncharacterized membrane protein YgcG